MHTIDVGIDGFLSTITVGWQAQEVRIGDVDGDGMVDAFLTVGDPIYTNIDGNVKIVGHYGEEMKIKYVSFFIFYTTLCFSQYYPSDNWHLSAITPYYLSSTQEENISDVLRYSINSSNFRDSIVFINALRACGDFDFVVEDIDVLVDNFKNWNDKLNFIAKVSPEDALVFKIYDDDIKTFVVLFRHPKKNSFSVFPLDSGYKLNVYDYLSDDIPNGLEGFIATIRQGWSAKIVRIRDVDKDSFVDVYETPIDPILTRFGGFIKNPGLHQYASYSYDTNVVNPLYNSKTDEPVIPNQERTSLGMNDFLDITNLISRIRQSGRESYILRYCDQLVSSLPDWNAQLNFIRSTHPENTEVYRINHGDIQVDIKVEYTGTRSAFQVFPMDIGYQGLFDNNTQYFTDIDDLWASLAPGAVVERVLIGDYNTDELIDAFLLTNADPIYIAE